MTQEELKNIILTHVNLSPAARLEIERFFAECEGITVENYEEKLEEWRKSASGKTKAMPQEELKNIILTHVNLGPGGRLEVERFFSECEGITVDNCMEKLWAWRESQSGKTASSEIEQEVSDRKSVFMQKGLTAIQRGDYRVFENTHRLGTYVVKSNETGFFGLITESKEEILPCIFDSISVKLDGWLELVFQGNEFEGMFSCNRDGFFINDPEVKEDSPFGHCLQQLVDLLNVNHRSADDQELFFDIKNA